MPSSKPQTPPEPRLNTYTYRVSAALTAHADITVSAASQDAADAQVRAQANLRGSVLTAELAQSASEQIRKEITGEDVQLELTARRPSTGD